MTDDIKLMYDSENKILSAFSSKPVQLINNALGYKALYYLDKFEYNRANNSLILTGNSLFTEDLTEDSTTNKSLKSRFERRREFTYLGSRMHFFRTIWADDLDSSEFDIRNSDNLKLLCDSITTQFNINNPSDKNKYLKKTNSYYTIYFSNWENHSIIKTLKDSVAFYRNGYFDPFGISWDGEMAKQRIADLLPFEYSINKNNH